MDGKTIGRLIIRSLVVVLALAYLWSDRFVIWNIDRIFLGQIILVGLALIVGEKLANVVIK